MVVDKETSELLRTISEDIRIIRFHLSRLARESYHKDLESIATTAERQEVWRCCDGNLTTEEIAKKVGITVRTVQYFIQDAEKKGLIMFEKRGIPKRAEYFDEIPSHWKPFKRTQAIEPIAPVNQQAGEQIQ